MTHSGGLRVLTWNLLGIRDYARLMKCVASLDVDIAALQEVDGRLWDQAETVADAFQHYPPMGWTRRSGSGLANQHARRAEERFFFIDVQQSIAGSSGRFGLGSARRLRWIPPRF